MCGRYSFTTPVEAVRRLFGFRGSPNLRPRYNVAPTQEVPVVRAAADGSRELVLLHWGLIPFWARERAIGSRMINARAESVAEKPSFRQAFAKRRCLVLADGFYEWTAEDGARQPWRITRADGEAFAFAGLWERWDKEAEPVESCTIITTEASPAIRQIHPRMPVMLAHDQHEAWLADGGDGLLRPYEGALTAYRVSRRVNRPANDDPDCIVPLED